MPLVGVVPIKAQGFDKEAVKRYVGVALRSQGYIIKDQFQWTIKSWKEEDKPEFEVRAEIENLGASSMAWVWCGPKPGPGADIWNRLDRVTTERHDITPKNAPYLRFPFQGVGRSYKPATKKRWFGSQQRQKYGPVVKRLKVSHPGHEAREWSKTMLEKRRAPFAKAVQEAVEVGLRTTKSLR